MVPTKISLTGQSNTQHDSNRTHIQHPLNAIGQHLSSEPTAGADLNEDDHIFIEHIFKTLLRHRAIMPPELSPADLTSHIKARPPRSLGTTKHACQAMPWLHAIGWLATPRPRRLWATWLLQRHVSHLPIISMLNHRILTTPPLTLSTTSYSFSGRLVPFLTSILRVSRF